MYEEKQLLKGLGSITRDEKPEAEKPVEEASILSVRKKVLVVEDEEVSRLMLGNAIEADYDVYYAADGIEAMQFADQHQADLSLILLDLQMPRMSGMEVLKAIKEDGALRHIPVIVLTADQGAELDCLRYGAADFIPKPYPAWEIIRARVEHYVELSETPGRPSDPPSATASPGCTTSITSCASSACTTPTIRTWPWTPWWWTSPGSTR